MAIFHPHGALTSWSCGWTSRWACPGLGRTRPQCRLAVGGSRTSRRAAAASPPPASPESWSGLSAEPAGLRAAQTAGMEREDGNCGRKQAGSIKLYCAFLHMQKFTQSKRIHFHLLTSLLLQRLDDKRRCNQQQRAGPLTLYTQFGSSFTTLPSAPVFPSLPCLLPSLLFSLRLCESTQPGAEWMWGDSLTNTGYKYTVLPC